MNSSPIARCVYLAGLVGALACSVFSQNAAITKQEFEKAWEKAFDASRKKAVQVTTETQVSNDGNIISTDKNLEQFLPPDRMRSLNVHSSGAKTWSSETVEVGDDRFTRTDSGKWLQGSVTDRASKVSVPSNILPANWEEDERLRFYVVDSILDGQTARVFSSNRRGEPNGVDHAEETSSVWISADGLILKIEIVNRETIKSNTRATRTVSTWSYDPFGVKIESPVINDK